MLNGTLSATERTLCCILENYQTPDGVRCCTESDAPFRCMLERPDISSVGRLWTYNDRDGAPWASSAIWAAITYASVEPSPVAGACSTGKPEAISMH